MRVFRACLIVIRRRALTLVIYFGIFILLAVVMTAFSVQNYSTDFTAQEIRFAIINRDKASPLIDGLQTFLEKHGEAVALEDEKSALQDANFFHATDYILILPKGFHDSLRTNNVLQPQTVTTPDSAMGYYADTLVNQYLKLLRASLIANPNLDEQQAVDSVLKSLSVGAAVEKKQFIESSPVSLSYMVYERMFCYIGMVLVLLCISTILMVFRQPDLDMRNRCSPLKPRSKSFQMILCGGIMGFAAWLLLTATGFLIYGKSLEGTDERIIGLLVLNSFVFLLVALAVANLASCFIRNSSTQNAVANFLTLGLCFLGGVFVPLEMLGSGIIAVAKFIPTYWYTIALDRICGLTSFEKTALAPVWQAMGIQLLFAVAITCIALAVTKWKGQAVVSAGTTHTELAA